MRCFPNDAGAVPRLWSNGVVVCLGGGPSLMREDVDLCRGRAHVIAVNDAYRLAPWADVLYAADARWWRHHEAAWAFQGLKYSIHGCDTQYPDDVDIRILRNTGNRGLELDATGVRTGMNSGYQAMNLAVHLGATRILLLGYDMQARDRRHSHWFGAHPQGLNYDSPYQTFRECFDTILEPLQAIGVEVVNCSRETALTCFPLATIDQALAADAMVLS